MPEFLIPVKHQDTGYDLPVLSETVCVEVSKEKQEGLSKFIHVFSTMTVENTILCQTSAPPAPPPFYPNTDGTKLKMCKHMHTDTCMHIHMTYTNFYPPPPPPHTHMHTHTHTHMHAQTHTRCPLYLRVIRMLQAALQALGEVGHHVQGCAILKHHPDASVRVGSESAVARHSALFQHWGGQWLHHLHRRMLHSTEHWLQSPYWPGSFPFANIHTQARLTLKVAQYCGTPS